MPTTERIDLRAELKHVARRFDGALLGVGERRGAMRADPGVRPDNIALVLPYFLVEGLPFDGAESAARTMAVGNAFGAAHFLIQDRLSDGDEPLSPRALELADRFLTEFVREYMRLPGLGEDFWRGFERYAGEFFSGLAWESEVLQTTRGAQAVGSREMPDTLRRLGHRMAPLKVCGAAAASLAGRRDAIPMVERFVDSFHAGYQLADDLNDLDEDLARGRWSVVAWMLARDAGLREPPRAPDARRALESAAGLGVLRSIADLVGDKYREALGAARELGSPSLVSYMERAVERATSEYARMLRRARLTTGPSSASSGAVTPSTEPSFPEGVHAFDVDARSFVYDTSSGLFFEADSLAAGLLSWLKRGAEPVDLRVLEMDHGVDAVRDGLSEIALLGGSMDDAPGGLGAAGESAGFSSLALHLTGACNLNCDYCYLGRSHRDAPAMSDEIAQRAVDLLLDESLGEPSVSIVFFGGEPLLCPDLIERVVEHARAAARHRRKRASFHVTTNGTLLESGLVSRLTALGVRILVSIDGVEADHDRHRVFSDGRGSYDAIAENIRNLPSGSRVGARATVTPESGHLRGIVSHLIELGCSIVHLAPVSDGGMTRGFADRRAREFEELAHDELRRMLHGAGPFVGNFADALASLETGRMRLRPCGAGSRYLSAGADGTLFLCHRFADDPAYTVGDVFVGIDRSRVKGILGRLSERAAACAGCWARWLCGGPCFYDLDSSSRGLVGPGAPRCALRTRILELAMWLYASLPPEARRRAVRPADVGSGPEVKAMGGRSVAEAGRGASEGPPGDRGRVTQGAGVKGGGDERQAPQGGQRHEHVGSRLAQERE